MHLRMDLRVASRSIGGSQYRRISSEALLQREAGKWGGRGVKIRFLRWES